MAAPQIFDRNMKRLAYLDKAMGVGYDLESNALWTATFSLPADDIKNKYCVPFNYVEIYDGDDLVGLFRILNEDLERSDSATRYYDCEHVLATLLNDVLFKYHQYGGSGIPTAEVIRYILSHQETENWVLATCEFNGEYEYNWENVNLLAALFAVPKCFDGAYLWKWDTSVYPWELSLVAPTDELSCEIRYRKNMTSIRRTVDVTNLKNRIYALGYGEGDNQLTIESVNNGVPYVEDADSIAAYGLCASILVDARFEHAASLKAYVEQVLSEAKEPYFTYSVGAIDLYRLTGDRLSRFAPGVIARIIDEEYGIHVLTRIVKVSKGEVLDDPGTVNVTMANKSLDISDTVSNLQDRASITGTYAQGSTNQQIFNFADNADAEHPAVMKLYLSSEMVRINKVLLNVDFESFRTYDAESGVSEKGRADSATITVDGTAIPAPESYSDIDIVEYLSKDGSGKIQRNTWHEIEITPNAMTRIVGAVFAQIFCNSRGGGNY